jgi:hypothetical protein
MSTNKQTKGNAFRFPSHVYVLTLEKWDHELDTEVIGVYSSKEAAVAVSGDVATDYGTFDEAIEPDHGTFGEEGHHEYNRGNPPDNGFRIQFGGRFVFDGHYTRLYIRKMPLLDISAAKKSPKTKRKANEKKKKATKKGSEAIDFLDDSDSSDDDSSRVVVF